MKKLNKLLHHEITSLEAFRQPNDFSIEPKEQQNCKKMRPGVFSHSPSRKMNEIANYHLCVCFKN